MAGYNRAKNCASGLVIVTQGEPFKILNNRLKVINDKTNLILELNGTLDKILREKALFVEEYFIKKLKENRFKTISVEQISALIKLT